MTTAKFSAWPRLRLTSTAAPLPRLLGQPIRRREDPRLVTGSATYVDDIHRPGMVFLHVVRSPHPHARIVSIDASAALARPGVVAVFSSADLADTAELVEVEYDPLPPVVDPERAMQPDSPLLYEAWGTNVGMTQSRVCGDPDAAFREADRVVTLRVHNQRVLPVAMECRGCLAEWRPARPGDGGELTLWSSTQIPLGIRELDMPATADRIWRAIQAASR
jgi:aerobic carbon-monoxide dehydrogenase large subunit